MSRGRTHERTGTRRDIDLSVSRHARRGTAIPIEVCVSLPPTVGRAVLLIVFGCELGGAQSLRGSRSSVNRMYNGAVSNDLDFLKTSKSVYDAVKDGELVPIGMTGDLFLDHVKYPFVLPKDPDSPVFLRGAISGVLRRTSRGHQRRSPAVGAAEERIEKVGAPDGNGRGLSPAGGDLPDLHAKGAARAGEAGCARGDGRTAPGAFPHRGSSTRCIDAQVRKKTARQLTRARAQAHPPDLPDRGIRAKRPRAKTSLAKHDVPDAAWHGG